MISVVIFLCISNVYISKTSHCVVRKRPTEISFDGLQDVDQENDRKNERMDLFFQAKDAFLG